MAEERVQRRLAAILAADVAGYSRLMGGDEAGTRARFNAHLQELIEPTITSHRGRIVKTTGDALLVEFASVVDAVQCAVDIQKGMAERNADEPDDRRIVFRVGVNLGDVIVEGDDIHGDGVNVAARLEALADPGGIVVSGKVHDEVRTKLDLGFDDLGAQEFKNIAEPVQTFGMRLGTAPVPSTPSANPVAAPTLTPTGKPSVVVLPFQNMSNDPDQDFFADGISEDLITDLSKLSGLFVIARNTAFSFRGQSINVGEVGRKLGVAHVLEGSVRKAGERVRINAQLIETATGGHVWADRYDGGLEDIFALQDEITEKIVSALQVQLTVQEAASPRHRITDSFEAYEIYLNGRAEFYRFDPEGTLEAARLMRRAIDVDPNFAAAYATLSGALQHGWTFAFPGFDDAFDQLLETAQRAVELDSALGLAHARLGWVLIFVGRYDEAIASMERAVELEPNWAETYIWFAEALNFAGDPARGCVLACKAVALEPVTPPVYNLIEGHSHYLLRDYDTAIELFKSAISRAPGFPLPYLLLGIVYFELSRFEDAASQFAFLREALPPDILDTVVGRLPYRDDEPKRRMRDALGQTDGPA